MGDRTVPFDAKQKCDNCDAIGAFDFMGDYLCNKCAWGDWKDTEKETPEPYKDIIGKDLDGEEWDSYIYPSGEWKDKKYPHYWKYKK